MTIPRDALDGPPAEMLSQWPSYGPAWDAAIAAGVDVALLEENLRLTPDERLAQLDRMTRLWWEGARGRCRHPSPPCSSVASVSPWQDTIYHHDGVGGRSSFLVLNSIRAMGDRCWGQPHGLRPLRRRPKGDSG